MGIVLTLHSFVRWLIVLVALIGLVKFGLGYFRKQAPNQTDRALMSGLSGLVDLQALLGIILLGGTYLTTGSFAPYRIEHAITMIIAVIIVHQPMRWRKSEDPIVLRNNALTIVAMLVVIFVGIVLLPQGWFGGNPSL